MDKLVAKSALYTDYQVGIHGAATDDPVMLQERQGLTMLNLVVWDDSAVNTSLQKTINLSLPAPGQAVSNDQFAVIWLGLERYLIVSIYSTVIKSILNHLDLQQGALQDLTSARTVIRIQGNKSRDIMAKGLNLPLDKTSFASGQAILSNFDHHFPAIIHNLTDDENDRFDIYITRSFALSFWHWLCDSSLEYGYQVVEPQHNGQAQS